MDHRTIDAENVAERYVTGRLPAAELEVFEEHFLDCPACCARIEAAERLERGLRRLAEEAAKETGGGARIRRSGPSPAWGLAAAACLVLALLPAGLERRQVEVLKGDLTIARGELARVRSGRAGRTAADLLAASAGELAQTRRDLAAEVERREGLAREVAAERQPQAAIPVLPLSVMRGGRGGQGERDGDPVYTLRLPRRPGRVALWIEPGGDEAPAYRVKLSSATGTVVLEASHLALNDLGALLVTLHSSSLAAGRYRLEVDALRPGAATPAAAFSILVVPAT